MASVFVSFDWENDRRYKHLLEAWDANPGFKFVFNDASASEIKSDDISRVKAALTSKIRDATHTLIIVGRYANSLHVDHRLIGYRNWINFEVAQSVIAHNKLVGVKLDRNYDSPEELIGAGASWAMSFSENSVMSALPNA